MSSDGTSALQRTIAVVVALAIHALLVLALVWRPAPAPQEADAVAEEQERTQDAPAEDVPAELPATAPAAEHSAPYDASLRESADAPRDPTGRAHDWMALRDDRVHRAQVQELGESIASIMRLPLDRAWPELVARAAEGDQNATVALLMKASECEMSAPLADERAPAADHDPTHVYPLAGAEERRWLAIAMNEDRVGQLEDAQMCRALGLGHDALKRVVREQGIDDPLAQWVLGLRNGEIAPPPPELLDAGDLLADLAARMMTTSTDERVRAEAVAYLRERAPESIVAAGVIATCYMTEACGLRRDDPGARAAIERSAVWGNTNAIDFLAGTALDASDPAEAWAWRAYDLALVQNACVGHALVQLSPGEVLYARHTLAAIERTLTAEQLESAHARLAALEAQHGARTRAALGCGP